MIKILCDVEYQDNIEQFLTFLKKDHDGCRWDDICSFLNIKRQEELCGVAHDCGVRGNFERNLKEYLASKEEILFYKRLEPSYEIETILKE